MAFCKNCNGVRKVNCVMCNGSGKTQFGKKCEFCHGQGKLPCPACDKAGLAVGLAGAAVSAIFSKKK
jgi:RecJ-like exonuclease